MGVVLLGDQKPRIESLPDGLPLTGIGSEIYDLAEDCGLILDPWQADFLAESARVRPDTYYNPFTDRMENRWAAFEVGLVVARQNGKGSILEARELAGLFIFGERLIIHSAHQFDTSIEAFDRILGLIEDNPDLDREVERVVRSHGEEGITLKSGQRLRFRTRTKGGGRGFTGDCIILDEAMYLDASHIGALLPTLSARSITGNPQVWYTGSAGTKDSTQFGKVRARGVKGGDPRLLFWEFSCELCGPECSSDCEDHDRREDPATWRKTNPGVGIRISEEHIANEFRSMDEEEFDRERLSVGQWPADGDAWKHIDRESWENRADENAIMKGKFAIAIHTSPNRSWSAIAVAGESDSGSTLVEITSREGKVDYQPGTGWLVRRVIEICKAHKPSGLIIDPSGQAGGLIDEIQEALPWLKIYTPNTREYAQGCGEFMSGVKPKRNEKATLVHRDQPCLRSAVASVDTRKSSGMWCWDQETSGNDITTLIAGTHAVWGYKKYVHSASSTPFAVWR